MNTTHSTAHKKKTPPTYLTLFSIFSLLGLAICFSGYLYYQGQLKQARDLKKSELTAIAELKVSQIEHWLADRTKDAELARLETHLRPHMVAYLEHGSEAAKSEILAWMKSMQRVPDCRNVMLYDLKGNLRLSVLPAAGTGSYTKELAGKAVAKQNLVLSDIYKDEAEGGDIQLRFFAPLGRNSAAGKEIIGVLVIQIDPFVSLYPLIQSWPVPSPSAESLLVKRDGNQVLFINELRFKSGSALSLRFPLDKQDLPAAMALKGGKGISRGIDYRGVEVLAAFHPVGKSGWNLVTKVDLKEIYTPVKREGHLIAVFSGLIILALGIMLRSYWKQQSSELRARESEAELERLALAERMEKSLEKLRHENELILESAGDGIFGIDLYGNFTFVNPAGAKMLGYTVEELIGKSSHTLCHHARTNGTLYPKEMCPIYSVCIDGIEKHVTDEVFWTKDGNSFPVQYTSTPIKENDNIIGAVITFTDITERKSVEEELRNNEARQKALLKLYQMHDASRFEIAAFINEECIKLSRSKLGFVGFLDADQKIMNTQVWCEQVMKECRVQNSPCCFDVQNGGLWAESIRQKRPIVINDYSEATPLKRGCPSGHIPLKRFLSVPVIDRDNVVLVGAVANKETAYLVSEMRQLELLLEGMWRVIRRNEAEQELQKERDFIRAVLDTAGALMVVLDRRGRIVRFNRACEDTTGYSFSEVKGRVFWDIFIAAGELTEVKHVFENLKAGIFPNRHENHWVTRNGEKRLIAWFNTCVLDEKGYIEFIISSGLDITERKYAEDRIKELNRELESNISELQAANREMEAFAYSVSHDLRTPLRAIDGFSRVILDDYRDKLDSDGKKFLGFIRNSTERMAQLIDDLLALSRLGRCHISFSRIEARPMVQEIIDELRLTCPERAIEFDIKDLPEGNADPGMIRQVFTNLLGNAIKFTRDKSPAIIEVAGYRENGQIIYCVRDNGTGFDMQYASKLFSPFKRLHHSDEYEGTGIGLAIVQRIISRHGGRVWCEAEINSGAAFYFSLPVQAEDKGHVIH